MEQTKMTDKSPAEVLDSWHQLLSSNPNEPIIIFRNSPGEGGNNILMIGIPNKLSNYLHPTYPDIRLLFSDLVSFEGFRMKQSNNTEVSVGISDFENDGDIGMVIGVDNFRSWQVDAREQDILYFYGALNLLGINNRGIFIPRALRIIENARLKYLSTQLNYGLDPDFVTTQEKFLGL
ncbi:hypothetical protein KA531_01940 [Candidatus Saccharibacteria bacterium]|nr:hypothetical protein [Candidatus Saccharibacteria bacterium]